MGRQNLRSGQTLMPFEPDPSSQDDLDREIAQATVKGEFNLGFVRPENRLRALERMGGQAQFTPDVTPEQRSQITAGLSGAPTAPTPKKPATPEMLPTPSFEPDPRPKKKTPTLMQDISAKVAQGVNAISSGKSEAGENLSTILMKALGYATGRKPAEAPGIVKDIYSRASGAADIAYAPLSGAARQYIGRPLEEAGHPVAGAVAENLAVAALPFASSGFKLPGVIEKATGLARIPGLLEKGKEIGGWPGFGMRVAGKLIDPLSSASTKTAEDVIRSALSEREKKIAEATGKLTTAQSEAAAAKQALSEKEFIQKRLRELAPEKPVAPEAPTMPGRLLPEAEAGRRMEAGETYKQVLPQETQRLYKQSSANYKKILDAEGNMIVDTPGIESIRQVTDRLAGELRMNPATKIVEGQLPTVEAIEQNKTLKAIDDAQQWISASGAKGFETLPASVTAALQKAATGEGGLLPGGRDAFYQIINDTLKATGAAGPGEMTVGNLIRLRQITREYQRAASRAGNVNARNAAKQVEAAISDVLGPVTQEADRFHRGISELVGPRSLSQKVFRKQPEQVIDQIFMPETGSKPNVTMIRQAKQIYQAQNPEAWNDLTVAAIERLQARSLDPNSLALNPQMYHRNWLRYRETFKEALPELQFQALDALERNVASFNLANLEFRRNVVRFNQFGKLEKEAGADVRTAGAVMRKAERGVSAAENELMGAQTLGLSKRGGSMMETVMNPWNMMAIAQVGQAAQALFTGNVGGAVRQLMQGVAWATIGNPQWIVKFVSNPTNAQRLIQLDRAIRTGDATVKDIRIINAMGQSLSAGLQGQ